MSDRSMRADRSVRLARAGDARAIAAVQLRTWRAAYAGVLPEEMLAALTVDELALRWEESATSPPSSRHRVFVALDAAEVVGFAATAPASDSDRSALTGGELVTLLVDVDHGRRGHGSRLLVAAVDHLRADGFTEAVTWLLATDDALRRFLTSTGWAPDGATRELDTGRRKVSQVRLHTDLTEET